MFSWNLGVTITLALSPKARLRPEVVWASGLGLGYLPKAPGTWGSLGALLVWWFWLADLSVLLQLAVATVYFFSGWWCSSWVTQRFQVEDASEIVADEVVGMWLALALLPQVWWLAALAFVLFRLFDIAKPGPIGWLDREVKGGLGVMLDDVLAGIVTGIVLYVTFWGLQSAGVVSPAP